jgi:hypothetical protein
VSTFPERPRLSLFHIDKDITIWLQFERPTTSFSSHAAARRPSVTGSIDPDSAVGHGQVSRRFVFSLVTSMGSMYLSGTELAACW